MAIGFPCRRIGVDISGNVLKSLLIAYDVFVISALPAEFYATCPDLTRDMPLHLAHDHAEPCVEMVRPRVLRLMASWLQTPPRTAVAIHSILYIYDHMHMVRHHDVVGQPSVPTYALYAPDRLLDNRTDDRQLHLTIDNTAEIMPVALRTYRDKIQPVIIIMLFRTKSMTFSHSSPISVIHTSNLSD